MTQVKVLIVSMLLVTGSGVWAMGMAAPATNETAPAAQFRTATVSEPKSRTPTHFVQSAELNTGSRTATNSEPSELKTPIDSAQAILQLQRYFFAAARTGEQAVLNEFLKAGYPVNERNDQSYTALMIAAYAGQATTVELLLQAGADACLRDKRGHTALMGAMIKAEWGIARTLYNIDCDKENTAKATDVVTDKSQMTAAQFAEVFGQSEKFKAMTEPQNGLIQ